MNSLEDGSLVFEEEKGPEVCRGACDSRPLPKLQSGIPLTRSGSDWHWVPRVRFVDGRYAVRPSVQNPTTISESLLPGGRSPEEKPFKERMCNCVKLRKHGDGQSPNSI
jgi:hypothetical protein